MPSKKPLEISAEEVEELRTQLAEERRIRESVLADPDIVSVLRAKNDNLPISVKIGNEEPAEVPSMRSKFAPEPKNLGPNELNTLSNAELVELISDSVEEFVSASVKQALDNGMGAIAQQFKPVVETQRKITEALKKQAAATASMQLVAKYPDYEIFADEIQKTIATKGLSAEEAYLLAKGRAATMRPAGDSDVERPSGPPLRQAGMFPRSEHTMHDEVGSERQLSPTRRFKDIVQRGIDNVSRRRRGG